MPSRLNDPSKGAIVIVGQRLHVDDPIGRVTRDPDHGWTLLSIPVKAEREARDELDNGDVKLVKPGERLQPERWSEAELEWLWRNMGSMAYAAQYLQDPVPEGGNLIKTDWLQTYATVPPRTSRMTRVLSVDLAVSTSGSADFSVILDALIDGAAIYILTVTRVRALYPNVLDRLVTQIAADKPDIVLVEDAGIGTPLAQDLKASKLPCTAITPEGDKASRAAAVSPLLEAGRVHLPAAASWRGDFLDEIRACPAGAHDD